MATGHGVQVSIIEHSGKKRARETAEIFAEFLRPERGIDERKGLAPKDKVVPVAASLDPASNLMRVGHLPFMSRLLGQLVVGDLPPEGLTNSIATWSTWRAVAGRITIDPSLTLGLDYAASNIAVTGSGIVTTAVMSQVPAPDQQTARDGYEEFYRSIEHPRCYLPVPPPRGPVISYWPDAGAFSPGL